MLWHMSDLLNKALNLEEKQPQDALACYQLVEKENVRFEPRMLLAAVILPMFGAVLAYAASRTVTQFRTLVALAILVGLGFLPVFVIWSHSSAKMDRSRRLELLPQPRSRDGYSQETRGMSLWVLLLVSVMAMFNELLAIVGIILFSGIVLLPILLILSTLLRLPAYNIERWPPPLVWGVTLPVVLATAIWYTSSLELKDFLWPPTEISRADAKTKWLWWRHSIKMLLIQVTTCWRYEWGMLIQSLGNLALGALLGGAGVLGILFSHLWQATLASGVTGLFIGWTLSHSVKDQSIETLVRMGRARCFIRLGRVAEAHYWLKWLLRSSSTDATSWLASALFYLKTAAEPGLPKVCREASLRRARDELQQAYERGWKDSEIWMANLLQSWSLAGFQEPDELKTMLNHGRYEAHEKAAQEEAARKAAEGVAQGEAERQAQSVDDIALDGLRSESFRLRVAAVNTLAQFGKQFIKPIIEMLTDEYPQVRVAAIRALEKSQPTGEWRKHLRYECYVPAGKFIMGDDKGERDERPAHEVYLDAFYIAKYPVSNTEYKHYMEDRKRAFQIWPGHENHPVTDVSWYDARNYAAWAGMRLLTEAEWEKAASWQDAGSTKQKTKGKKRRYPWGDVFDGTRCNTRESAIAMTTPVGKYSPQGDSPYGCADMAGNVWEWTSSLRKDYPYRSDDGREDMSTSSSDSRVLRGGAWSCIGSFARAASRGDDYSLDGRNWDFGFRVGVAAPFSQISAR